MHHNEQIASNKMIWLGIYPTEISSLKLENTKFTINDQRRMNSLLGRIYIKNDPFLINELMYLDQIKVKSGLQNLNNMIFSMIPEKVAYHLQSSSNSLILFNSDSLI